MLSHCLWASPYNYPLSGSIYNRTRGSDDHDFAGGRTQLELILSFASMEVGLHGQVFVGSSPVPEMMCQKDGPLGGD